MLPPRQAAPARAAHGRPGGRGEDTPERGRGVGVGIGAARATSTTPFAGGRAGAPARERAHDPEIHQAGRDPGGAAGAVG